MPIRGDDIVIGIARDDAEKVVGFGLHARGRDHGR
jgi:hypothetical protein